MKNVERMFNVVCKGLFRIDGLDDYDRILEAIGRLADLIDDADDVDWHIGENCEASLDSLVVGAYWFCSDYYNGMGCKEYEVMCRISQFFDPGCTNGPEPDSSEFDVYVALAAMSTGKNWDDIVAEYKGEDYADE